MAAILGTITAPTVPLAYGAWQDVPIPSPTTTNLIALQVTGNTGIVQIGLGPVGSETVWDTLDQPTGGSVVPTFGGRVALRMIGTVDVRYRAAVLL